MYVIKKISSPVLCVTNVKSQMGVFTTMRFQSVYSTVSVNLHLQHVIVPSCKIMQHTCMCLAYIFWVYFLISIYYLSEENHAKRNKKTIINKLKLNITTSNKIELYVFCFSFKTFLGFMGFFF